MTTINQAFIKAYRTDKAQAGPTAPAAANLPRTAASALGTSVEYVSAADAQSVSGKQRPAGLASLAESIDVLPYSSPPTREYLDRGRYDGSTLERKTIVPRRIDPSTSAKRPLASFIASPAIQSATHPGTTVASFRWPPVCRAILQQSPSELEALAAELLNLADRGRTLVGVLGLFPGRGCTTTFLCLAARLARRRRRIILVDGNFCHPHLDVCLDAAPTAGWQETNDRGTPLAEAIVHATDDELDLLAFASRVVPDPAPIVGSTIARLSDRRLEITGKVLREAYDLTLIDLGAFFNPVSQSIALELVRHMQIGAVLAVAGPEPADPRDLTTLAEHLGERGCTLMGTIENRVAKAPLGRELGADRQAFNNVPSISDP